MKILGLSAFYHDSACALIENGRLVCATQEERWTRRKHDPGFPSHSLRFCLEQISARSHRQTLRELDYIVFYDKPFLSFERLLETYLDYAPFKGFSSFKESMPLWLRGKLNIRARIKKELKRHFSLPLKEVPEILFNYHHLSHAASAFYPSPYKKAGILCVDGVGEWASASAYTGDGARIQPLWQIDFPHSLGLFYSSFTEYCGFKVNSGEYKLMGLAPYGEPKFVSLLKDNVIEIREDGSFQLNMKYFDFPHSLSQMASPLLSRLLGRPSRQPESNIDFFYMDVASSVQKILEEALIKLCRTLHRDSPSDNLCMAGGVALNCAGNGKILSQTPFNNIWIQPAAGDAGGALGAAYSVWHDFLKKPRRGPQKPDSMKGSLLGPSYSSEEIGRFLKEKKGLSYKKCNEEDLIQTIVEALERGQVVGWFQGAMEFGPRALGCRSILGDPRLKDMQKKINQKIKFRESFRPFAIAILEGQTGLFFEKCDSPYMLLVSHVLPSERKNEERVKTAKGLRKMDFVCSSLPAVTHVDFSCRLQTVGPGAEGRFRKLLLAWWEKTACPGLINTSFNVRGEPIVRSPEEALHCFMKTDMDILALGDYILLKKGGCEDRVELGSRLQKNGEGNGKSKQDR